MWACSRDRRLHILIKFSGANLGGEVLGARDCYFRGRGLGGKVSGAKCPTFGGEYVTFGDEGSTFGGEVSGARPRVRCPFYVTIGSCLMQCQIRDFSLGGG